MSDRRPGLEANALLPEELPSGAELLARGRKLGAGLPVTPTRYLATRGFRDERERKRAARERGEVTTHINLGYKNWELAAEAVNEINDRGRHLGFHVDRMALTADRRMGLPPKMRAEAIPETGQMLEGPEDWMGTGCDIDTQCECDDHNIGSPAAVHNTEWAIRSGMTYIGNLAQISYEYPLWPDDVSRLARSVEALGMLAAHREHCVLHNYLDDGFCGSFHDVTTMVGWAMLCRYLSSELVGIEQSQTHGSQWADPTYKQAFALALEAINPDGTPSALTHGDTNSFRPEDSFDRNAALLAIDAYHSAQRELTHPTGASLHVTPVSEAIRIPTIDDLVQSLTIGAEAVARARAAPGAIDWRPVYELRDRMLDGGRIVYERMHKGLAELGVDMRDPLQILLATTRLGAVKLEELFGAGEPDETYPRGRRPLVISEVLRRLFAWRDEVLTDVRERGGLPKLEAMRIVVASGDIHEYGLFVVCDLLERCGATVINAGTSVPPSEIAKVAREADAEAVAVGTYNGMALGLGTELAKELRRRDLTPQVFLGGRLTEERDGENSVDVREELRERGLHTCETIGEMIAGIRATMADQ